MHEILRNLPPHSRVLDLGSKNGSFDAERYALSIFRLDLEAPDKRSQNFVTADAAHLPFAAETFACVVANHNLEHIVNLPEALTEIRRVLQPDGSVYVAVPDASTFSDRVYRWLAHGGGHVNAFVSSEATGAMIAEAIGLPLNAIRPLLSSFSFANRHNERWSRRIALLGWGDERFLAGLSYGTRVLDRALGTRWSHYGWAFYFGAIAEPIPVEIWTNVCVRCGSATPASLLEFHSRALLPNVYRCPSCGAKNLFTRD